MLGNYAEYAARVEETDEAIEELRTLLMKVESKVEKRDNEIDCSSVARRGECVAEQLYIDIKEMRGRIDEVRM